VRSTRLSTLTVTVAFAAALSPGSASAAPPASEVEQVRKHFDAGSKAFSLGEFKRAIDEYKAAFNIKADPVFLYNIAQAYRLAGDLSQAVFFYRSYLNNSPKAPNRHEVEDRIRKLEQQLNEQRALTSMPPNLPVAPGGAVDTTYPGQSGRDSSPGGTTTQVSAAAAPSRAQAAPEGATSPTVVGAQPGSGARTVEPVYKKWWLWTAIGGVVVVGAAVGIGVAAAPSAPPSQLGTTVVF
jgi:hypothetical protein